MLGLQNKDIKKMKPGTLFRIRPDLEVPYSLGKKQSNKDFVRLEKGTFALLLEPTRHQTAQFLINEQVLFIEGSSLELAIK